MRMHRSAGGGLVCSLHGVKTPGVPGPLTPRYNWDAVNINQIHMDQLMKLNELIDKIK